MFKKTEFKKTAGILILGILVLLVSSCSSKYDSIEMSPEAVALAEKMKADNEETFSREKFPKNLADLYGRKGVHRFPQVEIKSNLITESAGSYKTYVMKKENPAAEAKNIVFYIHGGAYIYEINKLHVEFCDLLVDALDADVYIPLYPLAPEADYKQTYDMLTSIYDLIMKKNKPVYIMGDSAGGALTLSLVQQAKKYGRKLPSKMVLLSPFADCSLTNPDIKEIEKRDFSLQVYGLVECVKIWGRGTDFTDPVLCPIKGEMKGLPDTLLFNATDEIFYPDGKILYENLKAAGTNVKWVVGQGFWHVFPIFNIPERAECVKIIQEFVNKK